MFLGVDSCKTNHVIIRNELGPGRSLEYHCHSNGKDKGVQFLKFNEERNFEFLDPLFGKKNKMNCVLRQGLRMQNSSRDFEAYHTSKKNLCGQTREWIARTDGTYFQRNRIKPAAFVFPWINKKP
ncbi:hypothetical protein DY000_02027162 [Brassica cretica]|uniref:S-protein homolog n=1 Tax=Brassica cretica TaxID=69181 RepID=A0ABQ7ACW8_BRACR|nr:hypothetical protein DY000_02058003 [Brassica cretica]KAF3590752.1 hypothetical protein DY000_02027162 [Brassica cretica]